VNILFVHQNMPGQFRHLAARLAADPANRVVFLTKRDDVELPGVRRVGYKLPREAGAQTHHYVRLLENHVIHGQQVARACLELGRRGFTPDLTVAHPGWGEALYLKDVHPNVPLLNFCEFYYHGRGADLGYLPEIAGSLDAELRARTRNAHLLLSLEACDRGLSPTEWQKSRHPAAYHDKIEVIFDGIDTDLVRPEGGARLRLPDGRTLTARDEVVTYVARNLEPYRGFPQFVRALPRILAERPDAQVLVIGGDEVSYGAPPAPDKTWRQAMLEEVAIDASRVHFLGRVPYAAYLAALRLSSVHVYLTVPFVLSWSCLEAMAAGCLLVASATPPVEEVVTDGVNGLLVDMRSPDAVAERTIDALARRDELADLRRRARQTVVEHYALRACLDRQLDLVNEMAGGRA